ncbi:MAG: HDOD domain-containing protein [Nibricoccus sp.]
MDPATLLKEHILRLSQKLPTAPQIFSRLSILLNDVNADLDKIVNLISIDTGLTARVLRVSNSVLFRGAMPVSSLDEAINRVGFREIHRMVGVAMTEQLFVQGLPAYKMTGRQVWENSVATALAMEAIATEAGQESEGAFTAGILRQVGKLVLGKILEKEHPGAVCPDDVDVLTWERARLNITNHEASSYILESWKLPQSLYLGMRYQHEPETHPEAGMEGAQLHLAGWVVSSLGVSPKSEAILWEMTSDRLDLAQVSEEFMQSCVDTVQTELNGLKSQMT